MSERQPFERSDIPDSAFDIEYRTEWRKEVDFLASRGIYYTIRKREGEYGIPVYKYTKTADLFITLADFYLRNKRNARSRATFKGYKENNRSFEQQSFLTKDGELNNRFVVSPAQNETLVSKTFIKHPNYISIDVNADLNHTFTGGYIDYNNTTPAECLDHDYTIDIQRIKDAQDYLAKAADQIGKEKLDLLTKEVEDDTE